MPSAGQYYEVKNIGPGRFARLHFSILYFVRNILKILNRQSLYAPVFLLGKVLGYGNYADVEVIGLQIVLEVNLADPYWMNFILTEQPYEPEILRYLRQVAEPGTLFIDCGANIGYWSLIVKRNFDFEVISVEPAMHLVRQIENNCRLNGVNFDIINKALWNNSDEGVQFLTDIRNHAGSHIKDSKAVMDDSRAAITENVRTITLDQLYLKWLEKNPEPQRVIVKLDVEGAEAEAFAGAKQLLARKGTVFIYEDHGADAECRPTLAVLALGLQVYLIDEEGNLQQKKSAEEIRALKSNRKIGYNFVAIV